MHARLSLHRQELQGVAQVRSNHSVERDRLQAALAGGPFAASPLRRPLTSNVRAFMIQQHLIAEAKDISASTRWQYPDTPGSAHVVELAARLSSPETYRAFRETPEGDYLLGVIEAFEEALNDDWLPYEIVGLSLENAREFICNVARELEEYSMPEAIQRLRSCYSKLSQP